jgi:hypothetical protein
MAHSATGGAASLRAMLAAPDTAASSPMLHQAQTVVRPLPLRAHAAPLTPSPSSRASTRVPTVAHDSSRSSLMGASSAPPLLRPSVRIASETDALPRVDYTHPLDVHAAGLSCVSASPHPRGLAHSAAAYALTHQPQFGAVPQSYYNAHPLRSALPYTVPPWTLHPPTAHPSLSAPLWPSPMGPLQLSLAPPSAHITARVHHWSMAHSPPTAPLGVQSAPAAIGAHSMHAQTSSGMLLLSRSSAAGISASRYSALGYSAASAASYSEAPPVESTAVGARSPQLRGARPLRASAHHHSAATAAASSDTLYADIPPLETIGGSTRRQPLPTAADVQANSRARPAAASRQTPPLQRSLSAGAHSYSTLAASSHFSTHADDPLLGVRSSTGRLSLALPSALGHPLVGDPLAHLPQARHARKRPRSPNKTASPAGASSAEHEPLAAADGPPPSRASVASGRSSPTEASPATHLGVDRTRRASMKAGIAHMRDMLFDEVRHARAHAHTGALTHALQAGSSS